MVYKKHIFVCTGGKWCPAIDGDGIGVHLTLKKKVTEAGMDKEVRVNQSGCFSQCGNGPMVVVYPDNVWYAHVTKEDADEIFTEHILKGLPVERILYNHISGPNVLPRDSQKKPIIQEDSQKKERDYDSY